MKLLCAHAFLSFFVTKNKLFRHVILIVGLGKAM